MEASILSGKIGDVGQYAVEFKGGKLVSKVDVASPVIEAGAYVNIPAEAVIAALKAAIPGHFDDVLLDGALALLKS